MVADIAVTRAINKVQLGEAFKRSVCLPDLCTSSELSSTKLKDMS